MVRLQGGKITLSLGVILWLCLLARFSSGADGVQATHEQLRALRDGVAAAFNRLGTSGKEEDLEAILNYVHKNVVLNAMNGVRAVGHDGIRQMFRQSMVGENRTVQSVHHEFNVDDLSILYGDDTAIAYGTMPGKYVLTGGVNLEVNPKWLCTLVKEDGKWLIAAFQFGPSIFENPIAQRLQRTLYWAVGAAAVIGIGVGFFLGRRKGLRSLA